MYISKNIDTGWSIKVGRFSILDEVSRTEQEQRFSFLNNKESYVLLIEEKKNLQFVRMNSLVENCFNGEFYWPDAFHYGFKIL